MKILLIVPEYPPYQIGGGAEVYENLAREYQSHGHEVSVMFGYYPTHSLFENVRQFSK